MKTLSCTILIALLLLGCGSDESATVEDMDHNSASPAATEKLFTRAADQLVGQYSRALRSELMAALNNYGPAHAIRVCAERAQELAAAHSAEGWSVKRVSRKWRNVLDRPDTSEVTILQMFEGSLADEDYLTRWSGPDSARVFHYYSRIVITDVCLQCHGDLQTFDLDLYNRIKIAYPYDKATGYQRGDLRGMFVVSAEYPAGEDMAKLLAEGVDITEFTRPDTTAGDTVAGDTAAGDSAGAGPATTE